MRADTVRYRCELSAGSDAMSESKPGAKAVTLIKTVSKELQASIANISESGGRATIVFAGESLDISMSVVIGSSYEDDIVECDDSASLLINED